MVLVEVLTGVDAAQDLAGEQILGYAEKGLQEDRDVGDQSEDAMRRDQAWMIAFVDFDDDERGEKGERAECLDGVVNAGAEELVFGDCSSGRLQDESGLDLEEERG